MLLTARDARRRLERFTWETDPQAQTRLAAASIRILRIAAAVAHDVVHGELRLQAAGLVYATLLALIPLLAVVFSVLKAFGVHDLLRPTLLNVLAPLGQTGVELTRQIIDFVSRTRVGVLGAVGFGLLLYTSVSLLRRIEQAVNSIWHVRRARRLIRRLSDYLAVILVGPLLFFLAVGVTASLSSSAWFQPLHGVATLGAKSIPYVLIIGAHALIYVFVPNTKVHVRSALVGATVAGVLWQSVGLAFAAVIGNSVQYRAIYASLAILIFFMLWLYVSWLNVLIGASIAHYHQHPERIAREPREAAALLSIRRKERLGLLIVRCVGADYYAGNKPWTAEALARALQQPPPAVESLLAAYVRAGLMARTQDSPPGYLPARPIETVSLAEIVQTVRAADIDRGPRTPDAAVDAVVAAMDAAIGRALAGRSWRDLALVDEARVQQALLGPAEVRFAGGLSKKG
jgi:membrane protein